MDDFKERVFRTFIITVDYFKEAWEIKEKYRKELVEAIESLSAGPTLEDTLIEKIGGGPHGYGDPADTSIRKEEHFLFPRMIWKKVRFEKCLSVTNEFYNCAALLQNGTVQDCHKEEKAMMDCRSMYYSPGKIDEVENECISEYIKLRSKFRESASEEDLWNMKMLMLEPYYHQLRERQKELEREKIFEREKLRKGEN